MTERVGTSVEATEILDNSAPSETVETVNPLTGRAQITAIELFDKAAAERASQLAQFEQTYSGRKQQLEEQHSRVIDLLIRDYRDERSRLECEYADGLEAVEQLHKASHHRVLTEHAAFLTKVDGEVDAKIAAAKKKFSATKQAATEAFDAVKYNPRQKFQVIEQDVEQRRTELQAIEDLALQTLRSRRCKPSHDEPESSDKWVVDVPESTDKYEQSKEVAQRALRELSGQWAGRFIASGWPFLIFVLVAVAIVWPKTLLGYGTTFGWMTGLALGALPGVVAYCWAFPRAKRESIEVYERLRNALTDARKALHSTLEHEREECDTQTREIIRVRDEKLGVAKQEFSAITKSLEQQRSQLKAEAETKVPLRRKEADQSRIHELDRLSEKYPPVLDELENEFQSEKGKLVAEHEQELAVIQGEYDGAVAEIEQHWNVGRTEFCHLVNEMTDYCDRRCPPWQQLAMDGLRTATEPPRALRFGQFTPSFADATSDVIGQSVTMPAMLSFPERPSLIFKSEGDGRDHAARGMQSVMLRLLTSLPPGKVRFTIIDPIGLGQNFSAFMHLADFDERLVNNRIWTESSHINQRLVDLTEHMENVIQKYLRNDFRSIEEYNRHAGEVAEPFQILVVANFPNNFSDEAARRLTSVITSGARCGVYTLMSVDTKSKLPRGFELADVEKHAVTIEWESDSFHWQDPTRRPFAISLDSPPDDDVLTEVIKSVGQRAKDSSRVEVPFSMVAPSADQLWQMDSRNELIAPVGRFGATKLQALELGHGTSQHVLIAGKTGSGKSTLLHALITNLSLHYSPDEVQFYLIDFKKGVEFKPYATHQLPHARVIAIESEREFGMSVLERLDLELKERGDLFRKSGVQSVAGFRDAHPETPMPRILLIIDEFQELFVKDDKIAQDASLLLDRLVRQGRAFGIHILLGSQTLAGAYTLARSTIGQMAVRIALQCSESDAHLILSEDNTAARLLSRPGEAIYNDANGMLEGNHLFQVVWLPAKEHEQYLQQTREMAASTGREYAPPIVFEGNVPADPAENYQLVRSLEEPTKNDAFRLAPRSWLGAAVAIKEPTSAPFRRQAGANLLMVGQQEEQAMGVLANSIVSLGAQLQPRKNESDESIQAAKFLVLDGARPDGTDAGFWKSFGERLPLDVTVFRGRRIDDALAELTAELTRRSAEDDESAVPWFLVVHQLSRFRDLKKAEDDFGFGGFGDDEEQKPAPDKQFASLLREGPNWGIHSIVWCDTYSNVSRWFDRQLMRDLEMRILFQMGATDSSNLMDSPAASKLGVNRAYFYSEELGEIEKFRPYGLPSQEWIETVAGNLGG